MEKQIERKPCKNCIHYQMCVDKFRKAKQDGEVLLIEEDAYFADANDCYFYADKRIYRKQEWISVEERLPEPEKEVLIFAVRKYRSQGRWWEVPIITTAMYENGKVTREESDWSWYDLDFAYDEENDCYYIPEGWWEYRHYNPDDVYNSAVDDKVLYWMPLPEPPKGE